MSFTPPAPQPPAISRNTAIAVGVVAFHVAALWAIQSGLLRKAVEVVLPAEIVVELLEPPRVAPPPPAPPPPPKQPVIRPKAPTPPPMPLAIADPTPAPSAPVGVIEPAPPAPVVQAAPSPAPPAPAAPPAPPAPPAITQLSESEVAYITPPRVVYPPMSKRLGEKGNIIVTIYVDMHGSPKRAEIFKSSGFDRLDQAAISAAMSSRLSPIRRPGITESHVFAFKAPFNFVLE